MKYFAGTYQGNVTANTDILPDVLQKIHAINPNCNIYSMDIFTNFNEMTLTSHQNAETSAKISFNDYSIATFLYDGELSNGYSFRYSMDNKQEITKLILNYAGEVQINYVLSDFNQ